LSTFDRRPGRRVALIYLAVAAFCGVFAAVYEHFSHGVYSPWMVCLFAWPLVGGALPYALLRRPPETLSSRLRWARLAHHAAVASATVGSCVQGVLDIYGTTSDWVITYWIAALTFALAAAVLGTHVAPRD